MLPWLIEVMLIGLSNEIFYENNQQTELKIKS